MKLTRYAIGAAGLLTMTVGSQAAMFTSLDWQFTTAGSSTGNPGVFTAVPSTSTNPSGAAALATINIGTAGDGYAPAALAGAPASYGDQTGSWSIAGAGSSIKLDLGAYTANPGSALTYTVSITEFVGNSSTIDFFPGAYSFSLSNGTLTSHTQVGTTGSEGAWWKDTWSFTVTPSSNVPLSLTVTPNPATGGIYVDRLQWDINGDLSTSPVAVPEPMLATGLTAVGLALFGFYRKSRKA